MAGDRDKERGFNKGASGGGDKRGPRKPWGSSQGGSQSPDRRKGSRDDRTDGKNFRSSDRRAGSSDDKAGGKNFRSSDRRTGGSEERRGESKFPRGERSERPERKDRDWNRGKERTGSASRGGFKRPERAPSSEYKPRHERGPRLPDDIDLKALDPAIRADLRILPKEIADYVGAHLVAAQRLMDDDPAAALRHTQAARSKASRLAVVREAAGIAAYHVGEWAAALSDLRVARRLTGTDDYLPMIVDCERALGRVDKAQSLIDEAREAGVTKGIAAELAIIESGMCYDSGDAEKALSILQGTMSALSPQSPTQVRLRYAYAEILASEERLAEAREWFVRAADVDTENMTDAGERVLELDGESITIEELPEIELDDSTEGPMEADSLIPEHHDDASSDSDRREEEDTMPLCERYDIALIDLDGVVYNVTEPIPDAVSAINTARKEGMGCVFVTNNASRNAADVSAQLREMGIDATPDDVFTASRAAAIVLAEKFEAGSAILVVGSDALAQEVEAVGLTPVRSADDNPVAVVQGYGPAVGWELLAEGAVALSRGAFWLATNTDATLPSPRGPLPGNGALVAALATASGRQPDAVAGKPQPWLFTAAAQHANAKRPLVVGDRLETDIAGARKAGYDSLLVLTGVSTAEEASKVDKESAPTYVGESLLALVDSAKLRP